MLDGDQDTANLTHGGITFSQALWLARPPCARLGDRSIRTFRKDASNRGLAVRTASAGVAVACARGEGLNSPHRPPLLAYVRDVAHRVSALPDGQPHCRDAFGGSTEVRALSSAPLHRPGNRADARHVPQARR